MTTRTWFVFCSTSVIEPTFFFLFSFPHSAIWDRIISGEGRRCELWLEITILITLVCCNARGGKKRWMFRLDPADGIVNVLNDKIIGVSLKGGCSYEASGWISLTSATGRSWSLRNVWCTIDHGHVKKQWRAYGSAPFRSRFASLFQLCIIPEGPGQWLPR